MSGISTHVLDLVRGRPAAGIAVTLEQHSGGSWRARGSGATNADGRIANLLGADIKLERGDYRLIFDTGACFRAAGEEPFFPQVVIAFHVEDAAQHHHVPLLLSRFGYTTYRGS